MRLGQTILAVIALAFGSVVASANPSNDTTLGGDMSITNDTSTDDFMTNVAKEEGVITASSGLMYKVIQPGAGSHPTATSVVTVNYEGRLPSGKVFDSSYQRGTPASFGVSDVIAGWTEALQLMQDGSVWELYIPANLAYGARGVPGIIPANSPLIFKVELISFK